MREVAVAAPDDLDRFRQMFHKLVTGKVATRTMEQPGTSWKLDPPEEIKMEKTPDGTQSASLARASG